MYVSIESVQDKQNNSIFVKNPKLVFCASWDPTNVLIELKKIKENYFSLEYSGVMRGKEKSFYKRKRRGT